MALVFGMGVGLFILIVIWTLVIVVGLLTIRWTNGGPITTSTVVLAAAVTIILVLIPRGTVIIKSINLNITVEHTANPSNLLSIIHF